MLVGTVVAASDSSPLRTSKNLSELSCEKRIENLRSSFLLPLHLEGRSSLQVWKRWLEIMNASVDRLVG